MANLLYYNIVILLNLSLLVGNPYSFGGCLVYLAFHTWVESKKEIGGGTQEKEINELRNTLQQIKTQISFNALRK